MKTILVADDNFDSIELVRTIMQDLGFRVVTAMDGIKALEAARAEMPDLIILDVNMPGMTGIDVCSTLKSEEQTSHIPIIMVTARSEVEYRVQGLGVGADDYLVKPYSPRELMARVNTRLRTKHEADELRQTQTIVRGLFARYVAAPVVEQLLKDPSQVQLGGKLQDVTVLFADLEGFTSLSERTSPENLLSVLNAYNTQIVKIIQRYGGTIDKFLGDGVMALYNTPLEQPDHVARAVKTALHIQDDMYRFYEKVEPDYRLKVNFGIHTGSAVVGNVGTAEIMDFTAIGDTVNVAARLQGVSSNGSILISAAVYSQVEEFVIARKSAPITVKGRKEPVLTYEVSNTVLDEVPDIEF